MYSRFDHEDKLWLTIIVIIKPTIQHIVKCSCLIRSINNIYVYFTTKVVQSQLQIKNIKVTGQGQEVCTRT